MLTFAFSRRYGAASDPLKLASMKLMMRHHADCAANPQCWETEPGFQDFSRLLVMTGKHTWGGHTIIIDQGHDEVDYSNVKLNQVSIPSEMSQAEPNAASLSKLCRGPDHPAIVSGQMEDPTCKK